MSYTFAKLIPQSIYESFGDMFGALQKEQNNVIERLSQQGVFIQDQVLNTYILEPYKAIAEALGAIKKAYDSIRESVSSDITRNDEALILEAENKVVGLSYGFIGSGIDLIAYSIDDYREKQRQRKAA